MEKNRKLDPMDPKVYDIPRPSIDKLGYESIATPDWWINHGMHNRLRDMNTSRSSRMFDDTKERNK